MADAVTGRHEPQGGSPSQLITSPPVMPWPLSWLQGGQPLNLIVGWAQLEKGA